MAITLIPNQNIIMNDSQIKIAIVGMAGSGKTVLISTLANTLSQMEDKGIILSPTGKNCSQTLQCVQEKLKQFNSGKWPSSIPSDELSHLKWELTTKTNAATVRFANFTVGTAAE